MPFGLSEADEVGEEERLLLQGDTRRIALRTVRSASSPRSLTIGHISVARQDLKTTRNINTEPGTGNEE